MIIKKEAFEKISPDMIGLFFEDINFAADGGLYAEMIENRSFEAKEGFGNPGTFYMVDDPGYAWSPVSETENMPVMKYVTGTPLSPVNPHYLRFTATEKNQGFSNKAYDGIFLNKDESVDVVFYARAVRYDGSFNIRITNDSDVICEASVQCIKAVPFKCFSDLTCDAEVDERAAQIRDMDKTGMVPTNTWVKYEATLTANKRVSGGQFVITLDKEGTVDFDFISVIPQNAVAGIFRKDLFDALKELNPGFIRFPGGCIVEGISLDNRYQWKNTVGKNIDRRYIQNLWAFDDDGSKTDLNAQRPDSHYGQSYGIGFYEYFLLCELLGAKALPVLSMGVACQFRSSEQTVIDSPEFNEYVQDALDLIEFANGDVNTKWGALRASMGHEKSFNLEMIAVGNEQWETKTLDIFTRNDRFEKAIHEVYPGFKLIGTAGPVVDMPMTNQAWDYYRTGKNKKDDFCFAVDEHYYKSPQWMYDNVTLYDNYSRDLKVFAGEYAAHTSDRANSMESALAEAAFLTGLEKNAGAVILASYAPLFNRIGHSQWKPDMIWFDAENVYRTPNYYVQLLFANNLGDHTLKMSDDIIALRQKGIYVSLSKKDNGELIIKVVNTKDEDFIFDVTNEDGSKIEGSATLLTLKGTGELKEDRPEVSSITENNINMEGELKVEAKTFLVARINVK